MATKTHPATFIVGAGRVGCALALGLKKVGWPVFGAWTRRSESALSVSQLLSVPCDSGTPWPVTIARAELIILSVPDSQIGNVFDSLISTQSIGENAIVLHCSGAHAARQILRCPSRIACGTLHPIVSIAQLGQSIDWAEVTFGVEGDDAAVAMSQRLTSSLTAQCLCVQSAQMALYHAGLSIAANGTAALCLLAQTILAQSVATGQVIVLQTALAKLLQQTLQNTALLGVDKSLTGPVKRGDVDTIAAHVQALQQVDDGPYFAALYKQVAKVILFAARAQADALSDDASLLAIEDILS